ncbi:aspartate kinase homoserine dehydrogenase [Amylocystis lapponica]|nr:aspartate kinase homoserine dehydrogenase [Amylocystis lapponica]
MAAQLAVSTSPKIWCIAVVGVGLVGGEFISQLLAFPAPSPFRIVSLTSSKTTLYSPNGLTLTSSGWKQDLGRSGLKADLPFLIRELTALAGVNLITPNKKAFSADLPLYESIAAASLDSGARFLNEATVGAGLPVISTLKDLVATGDKIVKIEGVFSGTMSYIFNEFSTTKEGGPLFSSVVRTAREKGYTEPHPADDLNGADVARKLTILSRYIPALRSALKDGYQSVNTKSLVPPELEGIATGDEFIKRLPDFDAHFDQMRANAFKENKVLRFAGVIDVDAGIIKADLEKYPVTHPFATALGGSDNIIMFHTARYGARPLIVQGAGAGAAVTAMGVMSDLLKLV